MVSEIGWLDGFCGTIRQLLYSDIPVHTCRAGFNEERNIFLWNVVETLLDGAICVVPSCTACLDVMCYVRQIWYQRLGALELQPSSSRLQINDEVALSLVQYQVLHSSLSDKPSPICIHFDAQLRSLQPLHVDLHLQCLSDSYSFHCHHWGPIVEVPDKCYYV